MKKIFPIDYNENELREFITKNNDKIESPISKDEKEIISGKLFLAQNQLLIISNLKINKQIFEQNKDLKEGIANYKNSISKSKKLTYILIILAILSNILNIFFFINKNQKVEIETSDITTNSEVIIADKKTLLKKDTIIKAKDTLNIKNDQK